MAISLLAILALFLLSLPHWSPIDGTRAASRFATLEARAWHAPSGAA